MLYALMLNRAALVTRFRPAHARRLTPSSLRHNWKAQIIGTGNNRLQSIRNCEYISQQIHCNWVSGLTFLPFSCSYFIFHINCSYILDREKSLYLKKFFCKSFSFVAKFSLSLYHSLEQSFSFKNLFFKLYDELWAIKVRMLLY